MLSCYHSAGEETTSSGRCWSVWKLVLGCRRRTKEQVYQRLMCSQEVLVKVGSDCGCVWSIRPAPAPGSFLSFDHNIITPQAHNDIIATRLLSLANMTQTKLLLCSFTTSETANTPMHGSIRKAALSVCDLLCRGSLPWNLFEVIVPEAAHCVADRYLKKKQQFATTCNCRSPNAAQRESVYLCE